MVFKKLIRKVFKGWYSKDVTGIAMSPESDGFTWKKVRSLAVLIASLVLGVPAGVQATPAQAECSGCLCAGNPCKLCPLPPVKNGNQVSQEADTCRKIQEKVPPVSKHTEPNEHYASLNRSIMECVRNGGDVLMNSRRSAEFPSKHYCKPYIQAGKADTNKAAD
jgi:hypothetical protein